MPVITRQSARIVEEYVDRVVDEDNCELPDDAAFRAMSSILDSSFQRHFQSAVDQISDTPLVNQSIIHILNKRTCGGFKQKNKSLKNLTPFEQMFSVAEFINKHPNINKKPRTYTFGNGDELVPIWIKTPKGGKATLWTTMIGSNRGALKAPPYEELAENDPYNDPYQRGLIDPLTCLEMHRNPSHIGALAIKSTAFEADRIDHTWRYQNYAENGDTYLSASAELKKQKTPKTRKHVEQAAGYNLAELLTIGEQDDYEYNLLAELNYEEYVPEGYADDLHPFVSAKDIVKTFREALHDNTDPLDKLTAQIFATRLGHSQIPSMQQHVESTLFPKAF
ncbi:MAG: hypothetical protein S4CHLAM7_15280 [Chlamydiae bacterium]|nr:hypothetical protein [Chlamydiota bacterium]